MMTRSMKIGRFKLAPSAKSTTTAHSLFSTFLLKVMVSLKMRTVLRCGGFSVRTQSGDDLCYQIADLVVFLLSGDAMKSCHVGQASVLRASKRRADKQAS